MDGLLQGQMISIESSPQHSPKEGDVHLCWRLGWALIASTKGGNLSDWLDPRVGIADPEDDEDEQELDDETDDDTKDL